MDEKQVTADEGAIHSKHRNILFQGLEDFVPRPGTFYSKAWKVLFQGLEGFVPRPGMFSSNGCFLRKLLADSGNCCIFARNWKDKQIHYTTDEETTDTPDPAADGHDGDICGRVFELEKGQSDVLEMTFTPTSAGEKTLRLGTKRWEYNNGTWNTIFTPVASTTISISAPKTYELAFSDGKVVNAATGKIINSDKAHLQVTVENTGTNDYNNDIRTMVYYNYNNGTYRYYSAVDTPVSIAKGEKKVVSIDIDRLQDNVYWFIIVYKTDGEFIGVNDVERRYDDLYAYRVVVPSAIAAPIADPTTTTDGTIYNLNGQKVQKVRKGLYIMNGRKVMIR